MTLPQGMLVHAGGGGVSSSGISAIGGAGGGNTLSTANLDIGNNVSMMEGQQNSGGANAAAFRYEDHLVKELAFDLGVDMSVLKRQLMALFSNKM